MMVSSGGASMAHEQIEDLRERMRLLQGDRRANVDILEANKVANKEEMRRLREENKQVRTSLSSLQRNTAAAGGDLAVQLIKARKAYDVLKEQAMIKAKVNAHLTDDLRDLELQSQRPHAEDSPVTRNIRVLENRLDKALIKYNEAQSIKKTYEQIVQRLREERIGFDHQLAALERTYGAKQRDYEELLLLSGDANHAREVAQSELDHVRGGYEEERRRRGAELRERHQGVQLRKQTLDRVAKRERMRSEVLSRDRGDVAEAGCPESVDAGNSALALSKERTEQRSKIDIFENAFRKIKEATGVSDVNDVIAKIVSQESTTENLMQLTKENQLKIEGLHDTRSRIQSHVEEIKYSGPGGGHRRKMVDDQEELVSAAAARLERQRAKYERLAKMLIAAKAGIKHLQDKLAGVRDELGGKQLELTDETAVRVMADNEKMMVEIMARIRVAKDDEALISGPPAGEESDSDDGEDVDEAELLRTRPFNRRIELPLLDEEGDDDGGLAQADGADGAGDDELTREKVKKASGQILAAQEKRARVKKTPKDKRGGGED